MDLRQHILFVISKDIKLEENFSSFSVDEFSLKYIYSYEKMKEQIRKKSFDYIFIDVDILLNSNRSSLDYYKKQFEEIRKIKPITNIIILSSQKGIKRAVKAVKAGADSYLSYPIIVEEVKLLLDNLAEENRRKSELSFLRDQFWEEDYKDLVSTNSSKMKKVFEQVKAVAQTKTTIFLFGETGVGKGVIAKLIHMHSNRRSHEYLPIHCGAIPDSLLESELFGHEKGAFTGADRRKLGCFEIAQNGTVFLDEIGTINSSTQIKLLQILQDKVFKRVGGERYIDCDVRVISASNEDLKKKSEVKEFRSDLFYRLNIFPIEIPPLRERIEDIEHLSGIFLNRCNSFGLKGIGEIDEEVLSAFREYQWPGNIRELENVIERAYVLETSDKISPESIPIEIMEHSRKVTSSLIINSQFTLKEVRQRVVADAERAYLKEILQLNNGSISRSAKAAAITTRQLNKLMNKHSLVKEDFKNGY